MPLQTGAPTETVDAILARVHGDEYVAGYLARYPRIAALVADVLTARYGANRCIMAEVNRRDNADGIDDLFVGGEVPVDYFASVDALLDILSLFDREWYAKQPVSFRKHRIIDLRRV